ncbi:MAG TPA: response regulator [Planctomycetota bacterium]|nr:response regulator [Planctomycetota bacterium]
MTASPPQLPRSVMVVDDSGVFGFTLSLEFRKHGWDVYCCGSAEDALQKVKERTFDLILADVFMPGKRGDQMAEVMLKEHPASKIILMSSMPKEGLPPLPKGVAYLPKPVNVPMVLQAFDRAAKAPRS